MGEIIKLNIKWEERGQPQILTSEYAPTEMPTLLMNILAERRSMRVWSEEDVEVLISYGCWHYRSRSRKLGHYYGIQTIISYSLLGQYRQSSAEMQALSRGFSGKLLRLPAHYSSLISVTPFQGRICLLLGLGEAGDFCVHSLLLCD